MQQKGRFMKYPVEMIRSFGEKVFQKAGLSKEDAAISMDSFLQSDFAESAPMAPRT